MNHEKGEGIINAIRARAAAFFGEKACKECIPGEPQQFLGNHKDGHRAIRDFQSGKRANLVIRSQSPASEAMQLLMRDYINQANRNAAETTEQL